MKTKPKYPELDSKMDIVEIQDKVLGFWNQNHIFEKSVEEKKEGKLFFMMDLHFRQGNHIMEQYLSLLSRI